MLEDWPHSQGLPRVRVLKLLKVRQSNLENESESSDGCGGGGEGWAMAWAWGLPSHPLSPPFWKLLQLCLWHLTGALPQPLPPWELGAEVGVSVCVGDETHQIPGLMGKSKLLVKWL